MGEMADFTLDQFDPDIDGEGEFQPDIAEYRGAVVVHETPKAVLYKLPVVDEIWQVWIPRSQILEAWDGFLRITGWLNRRLEDDRREGKVKLCRR